ncbi:MAG: ribosomal protein S18-alanine N-acetyltransferase [Endozoicomonas sp. (ex Botrylloides leachii)]|nr:ribosomal protein S18-alanine N-acetyltransferase [Endozoicomonas sp. (ex Botrylloides leachii)]
MTEQDLPCVSKVEHSAGRYPWQQHAFIDSLKSNHCCKVALIGDVIIGHGIIMTVLDEAHLLILSVDKAYQRKGYAKALLRHLIQEAEKRQATILFLEVRESNNVAFQFYLNQGFNEIGSRTNYYPTKRGEKENAILMAATLFPSNNLPRDY